MKKGLKRIGLLLLLALFGGLFYVLLGGAMLNDLRARRIEKELTQMELPPDTEWIETTSFVGNTSGAGNHVEIWAGILVRSQLSEEELAEYFGSRADVFAVPQDLISYYPYQKDFIDFQALNGFTDGSGYFVVSGYYEAFTQIDLRGS